MNTFVENKSSSITYRSLSIALHMPNPYPILRNSYISLSFARSNPSELGTILEHSKLWTLKW